MTRILCVGKEPELLKLRCAVLCQAGHNATYVSVPESETLLQTERFDLVIVSAWLLEEETQQIVRSAGETPTLVLTGVTLPTGLLKQVEHSLILTYPRP